MSSKFKKWFAAFATMLLAILGFTVIGASAASAVSEPWVPKTDVVYGPIYDDPAYDCELPGNGKGDDLSLVARISGSEADGEQIIGIKVDGVTIPGDTTMYFHSGSHTYAYTVQNLNSTTDPKETADIEGSFMIKRCDVTTPVAPKVTGTLTGGLADNASVVNYDLTFDKGTGEGPWTITIEGPHGTVKTVPVEGSGPVKGSFPYACGDATFYVSVSGQDGYSSAQNVSIPCPGEVAPSVSATFQGSLLENVPTVGYTVNYNPGTHTGAQVVTIATLDGKILDLTFEGAGSLTGTFPLACGDHTLLAVLMNGEQRIGSEPQSVTVPCAVDNGGGTGGNTGGNTGGTTTPSTGGTTTTPVDNTTVPVGTNKVNAGATGDIQMPAASSTLLYLGITSLVVAAVILIVRRKLSGN